MLSSAYELFGLSGLLWVVDALEDSGASRSSTNLLPLFLAAELVRE